MFSSLEFFIAFRYLKAKRKEKFISVTALFSFIGILLGVATLIVVMSVMNGFREELVNKIIGINAHISIFPKYDSKYQYNEIIRDLQNINNIKTSNPLVENQVMITNGEKAIGGVARGLYFNDLQNKIEIYNNLQTYKDFNINDFDIGANVIIGSQMAISLNLVLGDEIKIISPEVNSTIIGVIPKMKTYKIIGIFSSGAYEYDSMIVFVPFKMAQKQFNYKDSAGSIEIFLKDASQAQNTMFEIEQTLGDKYNFNIIDWKGANSGLISALNVERNVMFLILTLIIIIAVFNIISSLIMLVMDKNKQIAILKTIGVSNFSIMKIFFICGTTIGVVGTALGTVLGTLFAYNIENIRHFLENVFGLNLFNPTVYFLSQLPSRVFIGDVVIVSLMSILLSFLATIYPAYKASKTNPAEILRYE